MFDLDAFCTSLTTATYGAFPAPLVAQIRAWAVGGKPEDLAQVAPPHRGWLHLESRSEALLGDGDDLVVRRILVALQRLRMDYATINWLRARGGMGPTSGLFASLVGDWVGMGMSRAEVLVAIVLHFDRALLVDDKVPTTIGAWLLTVGDDELPRVGASWQTVLLFARHAPQRATLIVRKALGEKEDDWRARLAAELMAIDAQRWLDDVLALLANLTAPGAKLWVLQTVLPHRPGLQEEAEQAAVAAAAVTEFVRCSDNGRQAAEFASAWISQHTGSKADALLAQAWSVACPLSAEDDGRRADAIAASLAAHNPALLASLRVAAQGTPRSAAAAIVGLAASAAPAKEVADLILSLEQRCAKWLDDPQAAGLAPGAWRAQQVSGAIIASQVTNEARSARRRYASEALATAIGKSGRAQSFLVPDALRWMAHEDAVLRKAAARLLASEPQGLPQRLRPALEAKAAVTRMAAVSALVLAATPECMNALEGILTAERSDEVRDALMAALVPLWQQRGRTVSAAELATWIERSPKALAKPVAPWLDEAILPPLKRTTGKALTAQEVRWLCWRQSRQSEIAPDLEGGYLLAELERTTTGDFALALATAFLASKQDAKDRWALTLAGLLGDDRVVPLLHRPIDAWVAKARGKLAEYVIQAVALLGSDLALQAVDQVANAYRSKNRNVGSAANEAFAAAAARRGLTIDELGDAVVPWLAFAPDAPLVVAGKKGPITVTIGVDGKLAFRDGGKNVASLPAGANKEVKDAIKLLAGQVRESMKAQTLRHARMLVQQRRWEAPAWQALYPRHPLLRPFAVRLVWGVYDAQQRLIGSFRLLEDGSLSDTEDDALTLPTTGQIGIAHPLDLSEAQRAAWRTHLADHEVTPPVPQLDRPVVRVKDAERDQRRIRLAAGAQINGMSFKGRAERLGWRRGSVVDAGAVSSYAKSFPAAGIEVLIGVEGMYMGMGMEDSITLGDGWFVRQGSVTFGSYAYDEPGNEQDVRVVPFGEVPAIVFSETMAELGLISGKAADPDEDET
jgi:hypothetical protein